MNHNDDTDDTTTDGPTLFTPDETATIRVTDSVGEVFGVDGETYDLRDGAVVELPAVTAQRLVEADKAEPSDPTPGSGDTAGDSDDGDDNDAGGLLAAAMGDENAAEATGLELNADTPGTATAGSDGTNLTASRTSAIPTGQLEALSPEERRRHARKRGVSIPTTSDVRDELAETIYKTLTHGDRRVVESPTGSGKTHTVAGTRWGARDELTGDRQVVHCLPTTDARDDAAAIAREHGGEHMIVKSRAELCPVAGGDHDPREAGDDEQVLTVDGEPVSSWIDAQCDNKGVPFSAAHRYAAEHNDQNATLPCRHDGDCPAIAQWERLREEEPPLVLGTHEFAHVPGLRHNKNVVFDERPDFTQDVSNERVRRAVSAFLSAVNAPVTTYEAFIQLSRHDGYGDDAAAERDAVGERLEHEPEREWYIKNPDAHTLAPALARAIWNADGRANDRRHGKTPHEPPRLDAGAGNDGWNREWVSVVLDGDNTIQRVRAVPDLSGARSVVGLDAYPSLERWKLNTTPVIERTPVLSPERRALWRQYERGLRTVQLGEATRPLTSGEYYDAGGVETIVRQLRERYGDDFRTAITADSVENRVERAMKSAGVGEPETMHYGNTMSRNDFAGEPVGFVNGCIDPGDDFVVDLLAEIDADATPERSDTPCEDCGDPYGDEPGDGCPECNGTGWNRAFGRTFVGPDAARARDLLDSVREAEVAQAVGRWARSPGDSNDTATVYVRTDVLPDHTTDVQVPGIVWTFGRQQKAVVEELRRADEPLSARTLASRAGCSKEHVRQTLQRLAPSSREERRRDDGSLCPAREHVHAVENAGDHGATLYSDDGTPTTGVADIGLTTETANSAVWGHYTWELAIRDAGAEYDHVPDTERDGMTPATPEAGVIGRHDRDDHGVTPPE